MNIILGILFLLYGFIASYFIANITGEVKNKRNIRIHHYELGLYLIITNLIFLILFLILNILFLILNIYVLIDLFSYMLMLSLGIFISDFKDFIYKK